MIRTIKPLECKCDPVFCSFCKENCCPNDSCLVSSKACQFEDGRWSCSRECYDAIMIDDLEKTCFRYLGALEEMMMICQSYSDGHHGDGVPDEMLDIINLAIGRITT